MRKPVLRSVTATIAAVAALGAATLTACSSGGSGGGQTIKLSMANSNTSSEYLMAQKFADVLKSKTNGKLKVQIFPSSQLGPISSEVSSLRAGSIQCIAMSGLDSAIPITDVGALPYMFTSMEQAQKVLNSSAMQSALWSKFSKYQLKVLGTWPVGDFGVMSKKSGVDSMESLKGMRVRVVSPLVTTPLLKAWGANPTPVDSNQVLTSLSTGLIDGVFDPVDPITSQGWQQYGKSFLQTNSIYNYNPVVFSQKFLDGLSSDLRSQLTDAFNATLGDANKIYDTEKTKALAALKKANITVYTPNTASMKSAAAKAESAWEKSFGADVVKQVRSVAQKAS